jgi:TPR repeat protein
MAPEQIGRHDFNHAAALGGIALRLKHTIPDLLGSLSIIANEGAASANRKLAEQEDRDAQRDISWRYFHGDGVPQDGAEAAKWFTWWQSRYN